MSTSKPSRAVKQLQPKQQIASKRIKRKRSKKMPDAIPYNKPISDRMLYGGAVSTGPPFRGQNVEKYYGQAGNLTQDGLAFLKCAFAPPDFANSRLSGVPDDFNGKSLVKKHRYVQAITFIPGNDAYILVLPTPGYAYWTASVAAGTPILASTIFQGIPYSDTATIFDGNGVAGQSTADIVDKFRFVSQHFEMVSTTNAMSWTGNIQVWKMPVQLGVRNSSSAADIYTVTGIQGTNATNADQYTAPFNMGVYSAAYNTGASFHFSQILEGVNIIPVTPVAGQTFGVLSAANIGFTGFDNQFDSICVKVSGIGANTLDTAIIKTWACVEYQVVTGSLLYEYQSFSSCDERALKLYRQIINNLPVGVSVDDNEAFWKRVLGIIRRISGGLAFVPGPYGVVAGGVNTIASALEELTM